MKRLFVVILLMVLLSAVFLLVSGNGISYESTDDMTIISPYSKGLTQLARLYFIYDEQLVSESRTTQIEKLETELSIVKELKKGSKIEKYLAPIADEVEILSVKTIDRVCYVSLSEEFLVNNKDRFHLNVMSIVNTLTSLDAVDYVQLLVDGRKISGLSTDISEPLARNTAMVQAKELTHKDIVKKFLEYVSLGRYDLAYDMIDSNSKQYVSFDNFRESMLLVRNDIKGYSQRYIFAIREDDQYVIQVKYILKKYVASEDLLLNSDSLVELTYSWSVIQEKGVWKILYYK